MYVYLELTATNILCLHRHFIYVPIFCVCDVHICLIVKLCIRLCVYIFINKLPCYVCNKYSELWFGIANTLLLVRTTHNLIRMIKTMIYTNTLYMFLTSLWDASYAVYQLCIVCHAHSVNLQQSRRNGQKASQNGHKTSHYVQVMKSNRMSSGVHPANLIRFYS